MKSLLTSCQKEHDGHSQHCQVYHYHYLCLNRHCISPLPPKGTVIAVVLALRVWILRISITRGTIQIIVSLAGIVRLHPARLIHAVSTLWSLHTSAEDDADGAKREKPILH